MAVISPFVLCNGRHATPHVPEVRALVMRFHTVLIVTLHIPDGLLEVISGLLVDWIHWITRVVGCSALALSLVLTSPITLGFWLGNVWTEVFEMISSVHILV